MIHQNGFIINQSIDALENFVKQDISLARDYSETNVLDNIVSISCVKNGHEISADEAFNSQYDLGSGLLLTTDGFILTANHIVKDHYEDWRSISKKNDENMTQGSFWIREILPKYNIFNLNGTPYPININYWESDPDHDLALIKAIIPSSPQPSEVKIAKNHLNKGELIKLVGIIDSERYIQSGKVMGEIDNFKTGKGEIYYDYFMTDAKAFPQCSGGAFINSLGELTGVVSTGVNIQNIGISAGAKTKYITEFLERAIHNLKK